MVIQISSKCVTQFLNHFYSKNNLVKLQSDYDVIMRCIIDRYDYVDIE